jgi:hypothetical protein
METVMMIPGELEHLESLVKVARRKKDAEAASTQVTMVSAVQQDAQEQNTPPFGGSESMFD